MAYKPSTNNLSLPSGIYAIDSATADGAYMAPQNLRDDSGIVVTEESLAFEWLVTVDGNKNYTLQVEQTKEYAVTCKVQQETIVRVANNEQFYSITYASEKDGKTYYQIRTQDNLYFKYNGDKKAVTAEIYDSTCEIDFLWLFDKLESHATSANSGPYKLYSKNSDYFQYNGITTDNPVLDRFGLKDTSDDRWVKFWDKIDALNDDAGGKIFYKVIFLGRHGHATNNSGEEAVTDSDRPKRDSPLTQEGYLKARNVQTHWTTENSLDKGGIGIPQISYCSPLMRCLVTNTVSFTPQLAADGGPTINTVVYEDCREQVSTHESEHRRCKDCIAQMFSKFAIDPNFASNDPLWPEKESSDSVKARAKGVLERIFKVEPKDKRFVSITAHSGFISAFLSVIGFDHRTFHLVNACVIPVICQYALADDNTLSDGLYKIQYVPEPSLFADGLEIREPVIASNAKMSKFPSTTSRFPSTWLVRCLDLKDRVYTIHLMRRQLHGMPKPRAYWNSTKDKSYSVTSKGTQDVLVILDTDKGQWRLIPSGNPGEYFIELAEAQSSSGTSSDSVNLVGVKSKSDYYDTGKKINGKPLIVKEEKNVGSNSPRWNFIPLTFPLALCHLSLKDVLSK